MNTAAPIPYRILPLLLVCLLIYLAVFHLNGFMEATDFWSELASYRDPHQLALTISAAIAFISYSALCYSLLHRFYDRVPWSLLLGLLAIGIVGCMFWRAFLEEVIVKALTGTGNYNPDMSWANYLRDQLLYALVFSPLGIVYYFIQRSRFIEGARRKADALRVEAELKFLRSQVNPHFLFNTLNNLYSLVHQSSPLALPALEKLSGLLRYSLYEKKDLVPIERELAHLRDLIHLEQMRVEGIAPMDIQIGTFKQDWCLPPLLLVPFVENAFKHGDLRTAPLQMELYEDKSGNLHCTIANPLPRQQRSKDGTGGIGLVNVRKRLELLYPGDHTLSITKEQEQFTVHLTLMRAAARRCKEKVWEQGESVFPEIIVSP